MGRHPYSEASLLYPSPSSLHQNVLQHDTPRGPSGRCALWAQRVAKTTCGARPLKRVIQKSVQDPLAEMILAGSVKDGETVAISAGKHGLTFNGHAVAQAA